MFLSPLGVFAQQSFVPNVYPIADSQYYLGTTTGAFGLKAFLRVIADSFYDTDAANGCAEWASNILTSTGSACGSGGGGGGNSKWATSTLDITPNSTAGIMVFSSSTITALNIARSTTTSATTTNAEFTNMITIGGTSLLDRTNTWTAVNQFTSGNLKAGGSIFGDSVTLNGNITVAGPNNTITWGGATQFQAREDGNLTIWNNAFSDFGLLKFGGLTTAFPALKRSGNALHVRLADDSGFAGFIAGNATTTNATTTSFAASALVSCDTIDTDGNGTFKCGTDATGAGGGAYPFQLTGNATSTLTQFNAGLTAYASSSITALTVTTGTTTSATSTSLFSTTASTTNLFLATGICDSVDINSTGKLVCGTDNSASSTLLADNNAFSGTNRFTNALTVAGSTYGDSATLNGNVSVAGVANSVSWGSGTQLVAGANGNLGLFNAALTDFGRMNFGGTTSVFPALAKLASGPGLGVQLADGTNGGIFAVGTSTPRFLVQLASSTASQLTLSDPSTLTNNHWSFRNFGGQFALATSSPSTFATSSKNAFSVDANGKPAFPFLVSCSSGIQSDANGALTCGTSGTTAWDSIGDATGPGAIAMGESVQSLDWDTNAVTAPPNDFFTLTAQVDSATDATTQRLFTLQNKVGSVSTLEVFQRINNLGATVPTGLLIDGTAITTAIDATDADIVTALSAGANDLSGTNWSITGSTGLGTFGNLLSNGSSTFQNFTASNSTSTNATSTNLFATTASSTNLFTTIGNALALGDSQGKLTPYTGSTCTNQFVRSLSALGAATCATVGSADVSLANLTATDSTLTFSGTYNGSTARTIGINLGNANTWSALQTFGAANSILASGSTTLQNFTGINATTTSATTTNFAITAPATAAGSFLAVDPSGTVIATSSPSFGMQTAAGRYAAPADAGTVYLTATVQTGPLATETNQTKIIVPVTGKLTYAYAISQVTGTLATTENATLTIRVNGVDTALTWTQNYDAAIETLGSDTDVGIAVRQGDYITLKHVNPTWVTNPTNVDILWGIAIQQ